MSNSKGYGIRFETAAELIDQYARSAPGQGIWQRDFRKRFCVACNKDKPCAGSKPIGKYINCADCLGASPKKRFG